MRITTVFRRLLGASDLFVEGVDFDPAGLVVHVRPSWRHLALGRCPIWIAWASRSKLKPFVKAARTIPRHFDGVIAHVKTRLTNGLVEGLNNKLRMIARRAFGFHSGGIQLDPPLPEIHPLEL